ncbi:MAG: PD-(D/E)XK nuclease family protein [Fibrobacteres bacterium]|nr:PD-(D/E)XK nuclease family protein [Fibrobacterota bacterium]
MKYFLPKPYLSYSAINAFLTNPSDFRKRYYENVQLPSSPELNFGKRVGEMLENDDESLRHILRYDTPEFELKFEVDTIPVLGYIDTYDSVRHRVGEYKTGKTPWTQGRVDKHLQLDIYSLGVETITGSVDDECVLVWLETQKRELSQGGRRTHAGAYEIEFTGKVKEFTRTITKEDRENAYNTIIRVAQDISEDYTDWLSSRERESQSRSVVKGGRVPYAHTSR